MRRIALLLIIVSVGGGIAAADALSDSYSEAIKLSSGDHPEEAVRLLEELYAGNPEDKLAEDILIQLGQISERRLADYDKAEKYYRLLLENFPQSRHARRAAAAMTRMQKGRVAGDPALREYNDILLRNRDAGSRDAASRMEALLARTPDFPYAEKALLFIGQEWLRVRDYKQAVRAFEKFLRDYPTSANTITALNSIGDAYIEMRNFGRARASYERLQSLGATNKYALTGAEEGLGRVRTFERMRLLFFGCVAILAAWLIAVLRGVPWKKIERKALLAVWPEALILSLALLGVAAAVRETGAMYARSVIGLWFGAIILLSCNHLYIQTRKFPRYYAIVMALVIGVVSVSLVYTVFYWTDLANVLWDSLRYELKFGSAG